MRPRAWLALLAMCACANEPGAAPPPVPPGTTSDQVITILNYMVSPQHLVVRPGSTVIVLNEDMWDHTVTSEAAAGTYAYAVVDGVQFDVYALAASSPNTPSMWSFSIPADAQPGTVIPYFCRMHGAAEINQGEIEIAAP